MNIQLKHRIVGIIILIALAVIIVPLFFTRGQKGPNLSSHIPNPPSKPSMQLDVPTISTTTVSAPSGVTSSSSGTLSQNSAIQTSTLAVQPPMPAQQAATQPQAIEAEQTALSPQKSSAQPVQNADTSETLTPAEESVVVPQQLPKSESVPRTKTGYVKTKLVELRKPEHKSPPKAPANAKAWTIQLGSFSEKANAELLVKQLRAKGFPAYVHEARSSVGTVSRVYVGPEIKRERADQLIKRLETEFHLKGVVVKYNV